MDHDGTSPDATTSRLEHDLELLEDEAKHVGLLAAERIVPAIAVVVVLALAAWLLGRRLRGRRSRRA